MPHTSFLCVLLLQSPSWTSALELFVVVHCHSLNFCHRLHPALNIPVKGGSVVPKIASLKQYCVLHKNNEKAIYIFFSVFLTLCHVGQKKSCLYFIEFLIKTVSFLFVTSVYMNGTPWDLPRTDFTYVLSLAFVCS